MTRHENLLDVLHSTAKGLHAAGTMDAATMREFDALCLTPLQSYGESEIKSLRPCHNTSQGSLISMHEFSQTIRSLRAKFKLLRSTSEELALAVDVADFGGTTDPAILRFIRPRCVWAGEWDSSLGEFRDKPDFSIPENGRIDQAYIKLAGSVFKLSFAETREPLVRWGFTAEDVQIERIVAPLLLR